MVHTTSIYAGTANARRALRVGIIRISAAKAKTAPARVDPLPGPEVALTLDELDDGVGIVLHATERAQQRREG